MNAKQSLKLAAKKIEEQEDYIRRCVADIRAYNQVIELMITGRSACEWCEDRAECQLKAKEEGKGCDEWMLAMDLRGIESYDETKMVFVRDNPADPAGDDGSGSESRGNGVGDLSAGLDGEHQEEPVREE